MTLPVLILAAGFGTRMGALTADKPKPLIEVAGKTLLDHALHIARDAGSEIAVNAHYRADQIASHVADAPDITVLHEPLLLDSAGAVKNAARHFPPGPIATLNADNIWTGPNPLRTLSRAFDPDQMDALMLLIPRANATGRQGGGDVRLAANGQAQIDKSADTLVHTGAQIINPASIINDPRDVFGLREVWDAMAERGRLFGVVHPGGWADLGHPGGLPLAEDLLREASDV